MSMRHPLSFLLALAFMAPPQASDPNGGRYPAATHALRVQNAGMEESPVRKKLETALQPSTAGLEESSPLAAAMAGLEEPIRAAMAEGNWAETVRLLEAAAPNIERAWSPEALAKVPGSDLLRFKIQHTIQQAYAVALTAKQLQEGHQEGGPPVPEEYGAFILQQFGFIQNWLSKSPPPEDSKGSLSPEELGRLFQFQEELWGFFGPAGPVKVAQLFPTSGGGVYLASDLLRTARSLKAAGMGPSSRLLEMGSGAGRVAMMAAAVFGASVVGVDSNPVLVDVSKALREFLEPEMPGAAQDRVSFEVGDIFDQDLSGFSHLFMYEPTSPGFSERFVPWLAKRAPIGIRFVLRPVASRSEEGHLSIHWAPVVGPGTGWSLSDAAMGDKLLVKTAAGLEERMAVLDEAAPQGDGILVIEANALTNRGGLEEFIARIGPDLKPRVMLFRRGSAAAKELAVRNGIAWVDSDDPADLAMRLAGMEERADRIGYVGDAKTAGILSRILAPAITVTPLDPQTALRDLLLFLGYPTAVLDGVNASGLEEQMARSRAA